MYMEWNKEWGTANTHRQILADEDDRENVNYIKSTYYAFPDLLSIYTETQLKPVQIFK